MTQFTPTGTRVLLREIQKPKLTIELPEGSSNPLGFQRFDVIDVGPAVNDDKWNIQPGMVVQLCLHNQIQVQIFAVDQEQRLIVVEREAISVIVTEPTQN